MPRQIRIAGNAEKMIEKIAEITSRSFEGALADAVNRYFEQLREVYKGKEIVAVRDSGAAGLLFGFDGVENMMGGLEIKNMVRARELFGD